MKLKVDHAKFDFHSGGYCLIILFERDLTSGRLFKVNLPLVEDPEKDFTQFLFLNRIKFDFQEPDPTELLSLLTMLNENKPQVEIIESTLVDVDALNLFLETPGYHQVNENDTVQ